MLESIDVSARDEVVSDVELHELILPVTTRMLVLKPRGAGMTKARRMKSGLIAPAQSEWLAREYGIIARIIKVGPDVTQFQPGQTILMAEYGGIPIMVSGTDVQVWLVQESDVLARVDNKFWDSVEGAQEYFPAAVEIPSGPDRGSAPGLPLAPGATGGTPVSIEALP